MPRKGRSPKSPFRSIFEERVGQWLDEHGVKYEYESVQLEYEEPLRRNKARCGDCGSTDLRRVGWYTPDFILDGGVIIEAKGRFTAADRRKMKAVIEAHPDERIVMLFMRDNKIHKNSKTHYSDWCMENNIDFAIKEPKQEWLR